MPKRATQLDREINAVLRKPLSRALRPNVKALDVELASTDEHGIHFETGVPVTLQRVFGFAPNAWTVSAPLVAKVSKVQADRAAPAREGSSASAPGGITQNDRTVRIAQHYLRAHFYQLIHEE